MKRRIGKLVRCESGATAIEYGLILGLVFLGMIVGISAFGSASINMLNKVSDRVQSVT